MLDDIFSMYNTLVSFPFILVVKVTIINHFSSVIFSLSILICENFLELEKRQPKGKKKVWCSGISHAFSYTNMIPIALGIYIKQISKGVS